MAKLTQEQLAKKTGTRKSFISRIENGHSDIQLSTLFKLDIMKKIKTIELDVDFIGGQERLTKEEERKLSEFFKKRRKKVTRPTIRKKELVD